MKLEVGDLVKRRRGKRKQEVGFIMEILGGGDRRCSVRVYWADGLKWTYYPNTLIKTK